MFTGCFWATGRPWPTTSQCRGWEGCTKTWNWPRHLFAAIWPRRHGDGIFSIAPAQVNTPVSFFKVPKLEAMTFTVQFPTGQNTLDQATQVKLSPSMYFNARLFCVDTRFARDTSYLFFAQSFTETHMAKSSMSIQLRKGTPNTRGGPKKSNKFKRLVRNRNDTMFMQPLGTPGYWDKNRKNLLAMVRQLGKLTFFLTFSAAEFRWPEVFA